MAFHRVFFVLFHATLPCLTLAVNVHWTVPQSSGLKEGEALKAKALRRVHGGQADVLKALRWGPRLAAYTPFAVNHERGGTKP